MIPKDEREIMFLRSLQLRRLLSFGPESPEIVLGPLSPKTVCERSPVHARRFFERLSLAMTR